MQEKVFTIFFQKKMVKSKKIFRVKEDVTDDLPNKKYNNAKQSKNERGFKQKVSRILRKGAVVAGADGDILKAAKIGKKYAKGGSLKTKSQMIKTIMKNDFPDVVVKVKGREKQVRKRSAWQIYLKESGSLIGKRPGSEEWKSAMASAKESYRKPKSQPRRMKYTDIVYPSE